MNTNISLCTTTSCKGYVGLTLQQVQIMQQWVYLYIKKISYRCIQSVFMYAAGTGISNHHRKI